MFSLYNEKRKAEDVFTPRAADINRAMYVQRPDLESEISRAFRTNQHIVIHGESGCGKSWLYKRVLDSQKIEMAIVNMANASRFNDLNAAFKDAVDHAELTKKTGYTETIDGEVNAIAIKSKVGHTNSYTIGSKEPFEALLTHLRNRAGDRQICLVLDNFEQIINNEKLAKQVSDIIILADDERYAKYNVKIAIVGVPGDIHKYFSVSGNSATISNRLREISEVSRLTRPQCDELVLRGFEQELGYTLDGSERDVILDHIAWVSDRIPERVQQYCLELAFIAEGKQLLSSGQLTKADANWLKTSLLSDYASVEAHMNSRETKSGRRNQTIFAIGAFDGEDFKATDIEDQVRAHFPADTKNENGTDVQLNISQRLTELSTGSSPLIRKTPKGDAYRLSSPKFRMCIRVMLRKGVHGSVEKVEIQGLN